MKVVVDRLVQYPNRFQLVNVSTGAVLGVFDLSAVTGTIQQVGTEIDAELFQSIQDDLTKLAQDIVAESKARGVDVKALQDSIATKITANGGELGNAVVTFSELSNASNIASGEKASTLFGKIKNWFSRLKALAFKDTIADADISSNANISQSKVSGLSAMQTKLNGIDAGANKYTLPVSTATNLGGVKVGSRLSVSADGTLSANSQTENSYTTTEKNKLAGIESGAQKNAVTSVAGKTGAVTLDKSNVGLGNVDNVKQYSASNPPPYPITDTGMQTFNRGTSGATSKVVINETDWDALVVKNLADENKKTVVSSDYVWIQDNASKVSRINADGILKYDDSHPNGSTAKFPNIPDGETRTLATQEEIPTKTSELTNDSGFLTSAPLVYNGRPLATSYNLSNVLNNIVASYKEFNRTPVVGETFNAPVYHDALGMNSSATFKVLSKVPGGEYYTCQITSSGAVIQYGQKFPNIVAMSTGTTLGTTSSINVKFDFPAEAFSSFDATTGKYAKPTLASVLYTINSYLSASRFNAYVSASPSISTLKAFYPATGYYYKNSSSVYPIVGIWCHSQNTMQSNIGIIYQMSGIQNFGTDYLTIKAIALPGLGISDITK